MDRMVLSLLVNIPNGCNSRDLARLRPGGWHSWVSYVSGRNLSILAIIPYFPDASRVAGTLASDRRWQASQAAA